MNDGFEANERKSFLLKKTELQCAVSGNKGKVKSISKFSWHEKQWWMKYTE